MNRTHLWGTRPLASILLAAGLLAACGGGDAAGDAPSTTSTATTISSTPTTTTASPATTVATPTTSTAPATSAATSSTTALSTADDGDPIDFFHQDGDVLAVIGVAFDDTLNVRSGPGTAHDVVVELEPLTDDVVATGESRQIGSGQIWSEVRAGGATGWANVAFLAYVGATDDITAEVTDRLGETPHGDTLEEIALVVAGSRASEEPPSEITIVAQTAEGDVEDVTVDVVGLGDDAIRGERLVVFGAPTDSGGYSLMSVERTFLCSRGVTEEFCS